MNVKSKITWCVLFAIAMGYLEAAVVVYLRELYYPTGFAFPLVPLPAHIARVEVVRELATMIMLAGFGAVAGNNKWQRLGFFALAFGVWDIIYYAGLYFSLGWPQSLHTWDILFLIPVPWVGPVWTPCLISLLLITGAIFTISKSEKNPGWFIPKYHLLGILSGAAICILSFMWDYLITSENRQYWNLFSGESLFTDLSGYVPTRFNVVLFLCGFLISASSFLILIFKTYKYEKQ